MLNKITSFIDTHPIGKIFNLGQKKAVWKKVAELKTGVKIAIEKNGKLEWDEIVSIKKVGRERVYDIEVEGTHNFVGNGIIAHNTRLTLTDTGDLNIATDDSGNYVVEKTESTFVKTTVDKVGAFAKLVTANIRAGLIESDVIKTNIISPVADADLIIDLQPDNSIGASRLVIKGVDDMEVASIDAEGNASFSGELTANSLEVTTDATISGTLYATAIESERLDEIEALLQSVEESQTILADSTNWSINTATASASIDKLVSSEIVTNNFFVTGNAAITSLFVSDNLTVKTINSLTETLSIQSLALAPLEIMAGKIKIDTNGDVTFMGNIRVAGNLELKGNIIVAGNSSEVATSSAEIVEGEINTNATAGKATLLANTSEIKIINPKVNVDTLIYVTPLSSTQNNVLYVKSKDTGEFTVGFLEAIDTDVEFNWWIIELENIDN